MTTLTLSKALNEGLRKALEDDPKVIVMGEDVGKLGGVFRVTDGMLAKYGPQRILARRKNEIRRIGIIGALDVARRGLVFSVRMRVVNAHQRESRAANFAHHPK